MSNHSIRLLTGTRRNMPSPTQLESDYPFGNSDGTKFCGVSAANETTGKLNSIIKDVVPQSSKSNRFNAAFGGKNKSASRKWMMISAILLGMVIGAHASDSNEDWQLWLRAAEGVIRSNPAGRKHSFPEFVPLKNLLDTEQIAALIKSNVGGQDRHLAFIIEPFLNHEYFVTVAIMKLKKKWDAEDKSRNCRRDRMNAMVRDAKMLIEWQGTLDEFIKRHNRTESAELKIILRKYEFFQKKIGDVEGLRKYWMIA